MKCTTIENVTWSELRTLIAEVVHEELVKLLAHPKRESDELLTREGAAKMLKISLVTLNCWTKSQKILSHRIGSRIYYKEKDIRTALKEVKYCVNRKRFGS